VNYTGKLSDGVTTGDLSSSAQPHRVSISSILTFVNLADNIETHQVVLILKVDVMN
jgi:hypothetical protein